MAIDGLGVITPFTSPAAGTNFSVTVPPNKWWRFHGGSFRVVASATVASRTPRLTFKQGTTIFSFSSSEFNIAASQTWKVCLYQQKIYFNNVYYNTWFPVGLYSIFLPAATVITYEVFNIQAGDQIDQVVALLEEVAA